MLLDVWQFFIYIVIIFMLQYSYKLYFVYSMVSKGHIVLKHSVPHFRPNFRGIVSWVAELNAALLPWYQRENMKILINN